MMRIGWRQVSLPDLGDLFPLGTLRMTPIASYLLSNVAVAIVVHRHAAGQWAYPDHLLSWDEQERNEAILNTRMALGSPSTAHPRSASLDMQIDVREEEDEGHEQHSDPNDPPTETIVSGFVVFAALLPVANTVSALLGFFANLQTALNKPRDTRIMRLAQPISWKMFAQMRDAGDRKTTIPLTVLSHCETEVTVECIPTFEISFFVICRRKRTSHDTVVGESRMAPTDDQGENVGSDPFSWLAESNITDWSEADEFGSMMYDNVDRVIPSRVEVVVGFQMHLSGSGTHQVNPSNANTVQFEIVLPCIPGGEIQKQPFTTVALRSDGRIPTQLLLHLAFQNSLHGCKRIRIKIERGR